MTPLPRQTPALRLLRGGAEFFPALIAAIDGAQARVLLETYIFHFVAAGDAVAEALVRAAARGVRVRVLVDGAGTGALPPVWAQRFAQAGVQCRVYSPLGPWSVFSAWQPGRWRRLHRKLCVVDDTVAFCGGINLLDDHHDIHHAQRFETPRLDYAARIEVFPLVRAIADTMTQLWDWLTLFEDWREHDVRAVVQTVRSRIALMPASDAPAALVLRDNLWHRQAIERSYRRAIGRARHDILIANAFFFPGKRLRRALIHAAQRGVRVRLLLPGHYEYFLPYRAARQLYGELLRAGVEIHEYRASFLHAKVAVIDGEWATVGSSNLDPLSLLMAREANLVVRDAAFAQTLRDSLEHAMAEGAVPVDPAVYAGRLWWQRGIDWLASKLLRFGVFLTGQRY